MKKEVTFLTAIYAAMMLTLSVVGVIPSSPLRLAFRYLTFIVILTVGASFIKKRGPVENEPAFTFGFRGKAFAVTLPLFAPTIAVVMATAALTSLLLSVLGYNQSSTVEGNLLYCILANALMPAVFEELIFRYLPIKLLQPYSRKWCVIFSVIFFSAMHLDIFKIPYAAVAGLVFVLIDIYAGGVLPSVILHFLNNLLSLLLMLSYFDKSSPALLLTTAGIIILISFIAILALFGKYKRLISPLSMGLL